MRLETGRDGVTLVVDHRRKHAPTVSPSAEDVRRELGDLDVRRKPWALLRGEGRGYLKVGFGAHDYYLEYRDARTGRVYASGRDQTLERVTEMFLSYHAGDGQWRRMVPWRDLTWSERNRRWGLLGTVIFVAVVVLLALAPELRYGLYRLLRALGSGGS